MSHRSTPQIFYIASALIVPACGGDSASSGTGLDASTDGSSITTDEGGTGATQAGTADESTGGDEPQCETGLDEGNRVAAASCERGDVQAAIDAANDGDVVLVPAGSCVWTEGITTSVGVTIKGAGIGQTIIIDETASGSLFRLETTAGKRYRISSFEFRPGAREEKLTAGTIAIVGESDSVRIDHNKFDHPRNHHLRINGWVRGVADNNIHLAGSGGGQVYHMWHAGWAGGQFGDASWSEEIDWGGPNAWYIESNHIEGMGMAGNGNQYMAVSTDTYAGARFVFRFNTLVNANIPTHGTGDGAGRNRSLRQFEVYGNTITYDPPSALNTMHVRGGTGIYYDNTHVGVSKSITLHYYRAGGSRSDGGSFSPADGLNPFDINDPGGVDGIFESGMAGEGSGENTLHVPGADWAPDQWRGYTVRVPQSSVHPLGRFNSGVVSNTADTITVRSPNFPESNPHVFVEGEDFEIRRVLLGLDQTGAGTCDLLTDTSTTPTPVDLHQTYDPVYVWGNALNGANPVGGTDNLIEDLHFMQEIDAYDGSTGMGAGPLDARPAAPSLLRTAYFAEDDGEAGTLHVWDGSQWTKRWSPYAYPHPLAGCP